MQAERALPDNEVLERELSAILAREGGRISIIGRQENVHSSSAQSEFLTVRLPDGEQRQLFCKYFRLRARKDDAGEFDASYETVVYTRVLADSPVPTPRFCGTWTWPKSEGGALLLESLSGSTRVSKSTDVASSMEAAATWLGAFHGHWDQTFRRANLAFLKRLDADYFEARVAQMRAANAELLAANSWLLQILESSESIVQLLLKGNQTIVHGEFYPDNILVRQGVVLPVDWETAAIGPGECDVATLTEGWPERTVAACREAYVRARWRGSPWEGFQRRLLAARVATHIHRLGWKLDRILKWRLTELRALGKELEII